MSVLRGEKLTLSIFGTSHGTSIGMILDGLPTGIRIDEEALATFMTRRAPGPVSYTHLDVYKRQGR